MQTDLHTVKKARKGDAVAFEAVLSAHERMIYGLCVRMLGDRDEAMDAAQETAVRVWRNIGNFTGGAALSTWIYRIATNVCLDMLRRRKTVYSIDELGEEGYSPAADNRETPEGALDGRETLREVEAALLRLPADQRAAVVMRDVQDMTYDEVAKVLGLNINTVKSRISRGRRALREIIEQDTKLSPKRGV